MSQHDYTIDNQSFPAFRTDLNNVLGAINSSNSGTSRPSSAVAGTIWLDTSGAATAQLLKLYDGADDILLGTINFTANTIDWSDSALAANSVDSDQYVDGSIDTIHIGDDQVTTAKIADANVTLDKLSATGTKDSTTFLRGDNTFAAAGLNGWSEDGANNNLLPASASAGIYLGVTSATAANLLDDYEEGTFTPTIGPLDGLSSVSYTTQSGVYTKVGRIVHFRFFLRCSGTANGNDINIYGLPFTSSTTDIGGAVFSYLHSSIINSTSTNPPVLQIPTNNTFIIFQKTDGSDFTGNDLSSTGDIQFYITGTYETA